MTDPLVSVVIPTYNRASTIAKAVQSVLQQSYRAVEVIVVDDGSTDATQKILRPFASKIHVVHQTNVGPSSARNNGIKIATGTILAFLDSDDEWLPGKIEEQVALLNLGGKEMPCCVCNAFVLDNSGFRGTSFQIAGLRPTRESGRWVNPAEVLATRFLLFNQTVAVRREAVEKVGGFREDLWLLEDYDLALRLALLGNWGLISKPLVVKHNETGGIGVIAMNDKRRQLRARETALRGFLPEVTLSNGKIRQLIERALAAVQLEIRASNRAESPQIATRFGGHLLLAALRLGSAMQRRLPRWPKAIVQAF